MATLIVTTSAIHAAIIDVVLFFGRERADSSAILRNWKAENFGSRSCVAAFVAGYGQEFDHYQRKSSSLLLTNHRSGSETLGRLSLRPHTCEV